MPSERDGVSSDLRLRLASGDPDPEHDSNQELASIYLDGGRTQPQPGITDEPAEADDATMAEMLEGLQIDMPGAAGQ